MECALQRSHKHIWRSFMTFMLMKSRMKINPGYACTSLHIFMIKFYTEYIHTTGRSPVRKCALAHHHRGTVSAISTKSCDESAQGPIIYVVPTLITVVWVLTIWIYYVRMRLRRSPFCRGLSLKTEECGIHHELLLWILGGADEETGSGKGKVEAKDVATNRCNWIKQTKHVATMSWGNILWYWPTSYASKCWRFNSM